MYHTTLTFKNHTCFDTITFKSMCINKHANFRWAEGTLPDEWYEATIIPILKANKLKTPQPHIDRSV